jgi:hypothetical protein
MLFETFYIAYIVHNQYFVRMLTQSVKNNIRATYKKNI